MSVDALLMAPTLTHPHFDFLSSVGKKAVQSRLKLWGLVYSPGLICGMYTSPISICHHHHHHGHHHHRVIIYWSSYARHAVILHVHFSVCVKAEEKGWKPLSYSIPDAFLKAFPRNSTLHEDSTTNLEKKKKNDGNIYWYLSCVKHKLRYFPHVILFNPHNKPKL